MINLSCHNEKVFFSQCLEKMTPLSRTIKIVAWNTSFHMLYHPPFLKFSSKPAPPGSSGYTLHSLSSNRGRSLSQQETPGQGTVPAQARLHSTSGRNQQHCVGSVLVLCCWLRFASQLTAGVFSVSLLEASVVCRNGLCSGVVALSRPTMDCVSELLCSKQCVLHVHILTLLYFSRNRNYSSA